MPTPRSTPDLLSVKYDATLGTPVSRNHQRHDHRRHGQRRQTACTRARTSSSPVASFGYATTNLNSFQSGTATVDFSNGQSVQGWRRCPHRYHDGDQGAARWWSLPCSVSSGTEFAGDKHGHHHRLGRSDPPGHVHQRHRRRLRRSQRLRDVVRSEDQRLHLPLGRRHLSKSDATRLECQGGPAQGLLIQASGKAMGRSEDRPIFVGRPGSDAGGASIRGPQAVSKPRGPRVRCRACRPPSEEFHLVLAYRPALAVPVRSRRHPPPMSRKSTRASASSSSRPRMPNSVSRRQAAGRPTARRPLRARWSASGRPRGAVLSGRPGRQAGAVAPAGRGGRSRPRARPSSPRRWSLDPATWGEFVVLKPRRYRQLVLRRRRQPRAHRPCALCAAGGLSRSPSRAPRSHARAAVHRQRRPGHGLPRAHTLFGEPALLPADAVAPPRVDLGAADAVIEQAVIAAKALDEEEEHSSTTPASSQVARAAHAAMPEVPLKGCDIMREAATGRLYVLEVNHRRQHLAFFFQLPRRSSPSETGPAFELLASAPVRMRCARRRESLVERTLAEAR